MLSDARKRAAAPLLIAGWENRGRADSRITIFPAPRIGDLTAMRLIYNGATGELIRERPIVGMKPSLGASLLGLIGPVHFGNFAGWWSRAVWFALGAASAYVAWSGLNLWVRRRADQRGWRALGRMTAWVGGGLPFAMAAAAAAYFVSLPSLATVFWTPAAFLIAAALALVPALRMRWIERLPPLLFGATGILLDGASAAACGGRRPGLGRCARDRAERSAEHGCPGRARRRRVRRVRHHGIAQSRAGHVQRRLLHAVRRMMLLGWLGLSGALVSAACIARLAAVDPKRRGVVLARPGLRRLLVVATFLPGLALGVAGRWSDFLIWVGAAAIFGWAIAALASRRRKPRP